MSRLLDHAPLERRWSTRPSRSSRAFWNAAPLETRVVTVRDPSERVDVDSRDLKGVAVWNTTADQGVNRSDALGESLRRAGAGRVLRSRGETPTESDSRQAKSRRRSSLGVPTPGSMPPSSTIA